MTATLAVADEALLQDVDSKIKDAKKYYMRQIGVIAAVFVIALFTCAGVIYMILAYRGKAEPDKQAGAAKGGENTFRGSAYRSFGGGPARMQWRAY